MKNIRAIALALGLVWINAAPVFAQTNFNTVVPPVDFSKLKVSDFADDELDLPYYLANFHRVANAVPLEGEQRGWITVSVWRGNSNQRTYNARVLESQLSLAFFYCTKRPWNPYYGHAAVRAHLEAMLERWCDMQSPEGKFSEYAPERWGLAPTAFATKFTGEVLRLLAEPGAPEIHPALLERVQRAQRKAILITLTDPDLWEHGRSYANQFSNAFAGGLAWLHLFPADREIRDLLMTRMTEAATELQSPAGYFYERDGPDFGYNLSTHHSNLHIAWHYARGTPFEKLVRDETRRFYEWLSWNAVIEPDGSGYVLNRPIETRQRRPWVAVDENPQGRNFSSLPQAAVVEPARAFAPSREEIAESHARIREELKRSGFSSAEFRDGDFRAFTPYAFLHRSMVQWNPTERQQNSAQRNLPYIRNGRYAHLRADSRHDVSFLYVRRPNYYLAFNSGKKIEGPQRYGPGLLWAPGFGALAQSQTGSDEDAWATGTGGTNSVYEAADLHATIMVNRKPVMPKPGGADLGRGEVAIDYPLGKTGRKSIRFDDDRIQFRTVHAGEFVETVPLLVREGDNVRIENNRVRLERGGQTALTIEFDSGAKAELLEPRARIGPYRVQTARIRASENLAYSITIARRDSRGNR